jgi:hypothetical protein
MRRLAFGKDGEIIGQVAVRFGRDRTMALAILRDLLSSPNSYISRDLMCRLALVDYDLFASTLIIDNDLGAVRWAGSITARKTNRLTQALKRNLVVQLARLLCATAE